MLPEGAMREMKRKGLNDIVALAASAPKGQLLFQYKDNDTTVVISVD
jgi:hypothetical protein